ncbi:Flavodoxin reductases (ferredoxin-NADPH reductases) family 1, partial [hydrothermal vent metagenome]
MTVTITQLISYPIKSCAGVEHQQTTIHTMGLATDRQLMLVDKNGLFLSQRKHPQMALIQPEFSAQGLIVKAPGMEQLTLDFQRNIYSPLDVTIWKDSLQAELLHQDVNQWFSDYLKLPVKLVKYGAQSHRPIDPDYAMNEETVAFADGYPLLVAHEATFNQLNQYLQQPVTMDRFRPNIVVNSQFSPWDELNWISLSNDEFKIDLVKPCSRCVMTG